MAYLIKNLLILLLCLGSSGCALTKELELSHKYSEIYGNGINANEAASIVKNEDYQELKPQIADAITSLGYTKVIFEDPKQGFIVLAKQGDVHPSQIILKYTATKGEYKTSIDLVKGSDDVMTNTEVSGDIQKIADQINNSK